MTNAWGSSWGTSWGNSWGTVVVQPPATNATVNYPRHERIGRPRPVDVVLPPVPSTIETGQGGQSVTARFEFLIKGAAQSSSGAAEFSIDVDAVIKQLQFAQLGLRIKMTVSVRATQSASSASCGANSELFGVVKSGGEALSVPSYVGEETSDPFFEARAA